jgi:hypothetical protein
LNIAQSIDGFAVFRFVELGINSDPAEMQACKVHCKDFIVFGAAKSN